MGGNAFALCRGQFRRRRFPVLFSPTPFLPNMLLSLHPDYVMVLGLNPQSLEEP